ncbi:MAG: winged helix-turn-helix domain-containing tetratricopeptide repeat protein [Vicinamibacteria bacterium]
MILRFGPFELDPRSHELRRRGALVRLQQQPARVLTQLALRPGELVSREEIQRALWGDGTHVDFDQGLNYCVKEIRAALGDDAEAPRYVETLPRRGYRFVASVERRGAESEPQADAIPAQPPGGSGGSPRPRGRSRLLAGLATAAALAAAGTAVLLARPELRPPAQGRHMIAVLPFANLSADPGQDYLSEGLTEELIAQLGRLSPERIGVIARTSVMRYKDGRSDVEQIGRELRVGYLVEGSVRRGDDRLRISVSLVKVADRTQLWSETYEREPEDLLTLQGEVARSIARRVELALVPGAGQPGRADGAADGVAYDLYLRGRFFWNRRDAEGLARAVEYFERAIAREPGEARAWVGLADAWIVLGDHGHVPPGQALPAARRAAERALELDPGSAEALTSVAMIRGSYEWRWDEAVTGFEAAIRANPNYGTAHHWFAHTLRARGRLQESLAQMRHALELDPLSVMINNNVGTALFYVGRLGEAETYYRRSLEMDAGYCPAYWGLGRVAVHTGRVAEGLRLLAQAHERCTLQAQYAATLAWGYAVAGRRAEARRLRDRMLAEARERYVSSYELAVAQLAAGDREAALAGLEQAVEERQSGARVLRVDERLAELRQEPRFAELARRLGL